MFCSILHKYSDWLDENDCLQVRWCERCNRRQRRQIKLGKGPSLFMKMLIEKSKWQEEKEEK
jgi:hypothetical protein